MFALRPFWSRRTLGEVCKRITKGTTPTTVGHQFVDHGINYIKVEAVSDQGTLLPDRFMHIDADAHEALSRSQLEKDDVLFSIAGSIGRTALVTEDVLPANTNQALAIIRPDPGEVSPLFLRYYLTSEDFQVHALNRVVQSVQANVSLTVLKEAPVFLPPVPQQRAIARILGSLDDKIELNREMNRTLEATTQAIFRSWFVDFDPVVAKADGRKPFGMSEDLAALFPDRFVESELGPIPEGWSLVPFSDLVEIHGGGTPKTSVSDYWDGHIPWFSVVDTPADGDIFVIDTERSITTKGLESSSTQLLEAGTTIITARGTVGKLAVAAEPMAMNQSCYGLTGRQGRKSPSVYFSAKQLVSDLRQMAHGSVFDTITRSTFAAVPVPAGPAQVVEAFDQLVDPLLERLKIGVYENQTLAALRDLLLPKLLSGEIRVREAEEAVEAAV